MSQRARNELERLRQKYARVFGVDLREVHSEEDGVDSYSVYVPSRPDLPKWSTGECP